MQSGVDVTDWAVEAQTAKWPYVPALGAATGRTIGWMIK
jgi:hypothetical protein